MADNDLAAAPVETENESLTLDDGVDKLTDLLSGPSDETPANEEQATSTDETDDLEADEAEESEDENVDESDDDEDETDEDDDESSDDDEESFAADDANVTLDDGTVISVADLKRNNLYQRDYTKKTTELADDRRVLDNDRATLKSTQVEVTNYVQGLQQEREILLAYQAQHMPQMPDDSLIDSDIIEYTQQRATYDNAVNNYNNIFQQHEQSKQAIAEQERATQTESDAVRTSGILEHHADLRDPDKAKAFDKDFNDIFLPHYGFTEKEIVEVIDHRMISVIRDANAWRKLQQAKPETKKRVKAKAEGKPPMLTGKRRVTSAQKTSRNAKARAARAAKSGSVDDAILSLMDMDL